MAVPSSDAPSPASTVVVLRDSPSGPEAFMVRRHEDTAFMGGAHVFPGGRVDAADWGIADDGWCDGIEQAARRLANVPAADAVAFHIAAARELFEEAGVLLARDAPGDFVSLAGASVHERFMRYRAGVHSGSQSLRAVVEQEGLRLALDALVPFAHWLTPPHDTRRFDTRFFLARVPSHQTPAHDEKETTHGTWIAPADALSRCQRNQIVLPIPTWTTLRELEAFDSVDGAIRWAQQRRIVCREPQLVEEDGRKMFLLPGDPLNAEPWNEPVPTETRFVQTDGRWRATRRPA